MQRLRRTGVAALLGLAGAATGTFIEGGSGAGAGPACSIATVKGSYAIYGSGFAFGTPWAATGTVTFDGSGNSRGTLVENSAGEIDDATFTATYTIDPDCRGSLILTMEHLARAGGGSHEYRHDNHAVSIVVAGGGQTIFWVVTDTYSRGVPAGVPEIPDPVVTASGSLGRM